MKEKLEFNNIIKLIFTNIEISRFVKKFRKFVLKKILRLRLITIFENNS